MTGLLTPPGTGRLGLRLTADRDGRAALAIYRPLTVKGRLMRRAVAALTVLPGSPGPDDPEVVQVARLLEIESCGACVMKSSKSGRHVLGLASSGRLRAVVKVGRVDDLALRQEADTLARLDGVAGLRVPVLLAATELDGRFFCATEPVLGRAAHGWRPALAASLALARAGWTHGDLVPWNLLEGPATLLDWERAEPVLLPMHDLAHYVVQSGALLRTADAAATVALLCGADGPGAVYLSALGLPPDSAAPLVVAYLDRISLRGASDREWRFREDIRKVLGCGS